VNRHKGHAVRKNVAAAFGSEPDMPSHGDPWCALFTAASGHVRAQDQDGLVPFWVYPVTVGARIERRSATCWDRASSFCWLCHRHPWKLLNLEPRVPFSIWRPSAPLSARREKPPGNSRPARSSEATADPVPQCWKA
jgi:hypothetical protein